jgi:hypothetical protein
MDFGLNRERIRAGGERGAQFRSRGGLAGRDLSPVLGKVWRGSCQHYQLRGAMGQEEEVTAAWRVVCPGSSAIPLRHLPLSFLVKMFLISFVLPGFPGGGKVNGWSPLSTAWEGSLCLIVNPGLSLTVLEAVA